MKSLLKKLIPESIILLYHKLLAIAANLLYGQPSNKLIVIGVTGTNGKSTTARLIADILTAAGYQVGLTSTVEFQISRKQWLNDKKMTMLGRLALQKMLAQMVKAGCQYAVIETSSEGIKQYRHLGINYDVVLFTNLTPEHLEAHGGFQNYKAVKGELFAHLTAKPQKTINGQTIPKISIVNLDDEHASYFLQFKADQKFGFTTKAQYDILGVEEIRAANIEITAEGTRFTIADKRFSTPLLGEFNLYNVLAAATAALALDINLDTLISAIAKIRGVPGRLEIITRSPFTVIVDQAPEPAALTKLYEAIYETVLSGVPSLPALSEAEGSKKRNRIIHVLGACGGGRDKARRPKLGEIAAKHADYVIITNEDPYDEDPQTIIDQVADGALKAGKKLNENLFKILDRRQAIRKALKLGQPNDLVLITGKGAEQAICVARGKKIPWDDRKVVREELSKLT